MANITGTNGNDTLTGTADADTIQGLSGNDIIKSSVGGDLIDGGAGNDTVDYSSPDDGVSDFINFDVRLPNGSTYGFPTDEFLTVRRDRSFLGREDRLLNIETIVARVSPQGQRNTNVINIDAGVADVDVDLTKNRVIYSSPLYGTKILGINNFAYVTINGSGNYRIKGDDQDNTLNSFFSGDSTIIASKGNDSITAKTIDYSKIGNAVTVFMSAIINTQRGNNFLSYFENIEKGGVGTDRTGGTTQKIIGTNNKENTLDAGSTFNNSNTEINLLKNYFKAIDLGSTSIVGPQQIEIVSFVNAVGTKNNDTIVGANKKGKLTGGGGSDNITGGNKNDTITGSDSTARGVGEVDTLTGGGGRDKFVLGDKNGAYYVGQGKDDYATITDFNLFQDSIDLRGFKDYSFASGCNNTIELYSGKDANTRDLIAKIQLTGGISNRSTNSRSVMGADPNLNAITSKLDILVGSSSTADAQV